MDIKNEFDLINSELLNNKILTIKKVNEEALKTKELIIVKLKKEMLETNFDINIVPIINKFYQKLININNFVRKNLVFNIKNEPDDIMFLQKNIISINIDSKNVEVKEEVKGVFELILYNLTVQNKLDAYSYKNVKQIIIEEENKFISFVNNILNNVLDENKKIVIKKYNEIMEYKAKENPDKYKINNKFLLKYAESYLIKTSTDMLNVLKNNLKSKIDENIDDMKSLIMDNSRFKINELSKIIQSLNDYMNEFISNLFVKLNDIIITTSKVIYSNNLKSDLEKYNNYINKIINMDIILDKEFMNVREKILISNKIKKDMDSIRTIDNIIDEKKDSIVSNIKIAIMDILKTNSFNVNKTITCTNFIKYSTKDKIEDLDEKDLIKMFDLLIKNE